MQVRGYLQADHPPEPEVVFEFVAVGADGSQERPCDKREDQFG
jgi:hypothetical protein